MTATLFVGTPVHSGSVTLAWARGAMEATSEFHGRICIETYQGSWLPRNRDALTRRFLDSGCSHMLCVDSDVAWRAEHARALLACGAEFVSGVYCRKQADRSIPASLTGAQDGPLWGAYHVPAGLLMIRRSVVERMIEAYAGLEYTTAPQPPGKVWGLWTPTHSMGEDVAFCSRWRAIGGQIWMHPGVVAGHVGEFEFLPDGTS